MNPLSLLVKPVSADCNLHCEYCFYCERAGDPYDHRERHCMDDSVLSAMIGQYMHVVGQFASFAWQGGEPMLAGLPFFERVIDLQKKHGFSGQVVSNAIQTNAVLMDDAWAELFAAYKFLVGVSLDGPEEDHDHYRRYRNGRGTFKRVMQNIEVLRRHNVAFNVLSVLTPRTVVKPEELYSFFVAQQIRFLQFIPCIEADISTGTYADFAVSSDQYGVFLCNLFDLWYNDGQPEVSIRLFDNVLQAYADMEPEMCAHKDQCGQYVVVEHNGDVYPCDFFVERAWLLGNLRATPLAAIVDSPLYHRFASQKTGPFDECVGCVWHWLCKNGCPRFRYLPRGRFSDTHSHCEAFKRFFAYSADRFCELAERIKKQTPRATTAGALEGKVPSQQARVGRNDPCPCGSGKKYKNCCMPSQRP